MFYIEKFTNTFDRTVFYVFESDGITKKKVAGPFDKNVDAQLKLIKLGLIKKESDPNPVKKISVDKKEEPKPLNSDSPTVLKLQYIVKGFLSGQVTNKDVTNQHIEVLTSFEAYYTKTGTLTPKQLEWCKSLLYKYNNIIVQLMKTGIKPVVITAEKTIQPTEDHRKYERIVEFDEPKKPHRRGRLIKEDE